MYEWYEWWMFKNAIPKKVCDEIIKEGLLQEELKATVKGDECDLVPPDNIRKTEVHWVYSEWVKPYVEKYTHIANYNSGWHYDIDYTKTENLQFGVYRKGDHYTWHTDSIFFSETPRKLTCIVMLSEPEDYDGGEFQIKSSWNDEQIAFSDKMEKGDVIVLPSMVIHRVTEIVSGVRMSLVGWVQGPNWK
jgi:PKHD-type hydroxylase